MFGLSSATRRVYMSSYENANFPLLDKILPLSKEGCLTVQHGGEKGEVEEDRTANQRTDDYHKHAANRKQ